MKSQTRNIRAEREGTDREIGFMIRGDLAGLFLKAATGKFTQEE
jgi:hypothetical protein